MAIRQTADIRKFLLENISSADLVKTTVERFNVSRTAVYQNIKKLVADGYVKYDDVKKGRKYSLVSKEYDYLYDISGSLSESNVWLQDIEPHIRGKENVMRIWEYGFTEMFNNAVDHSEGSQIFVKIFTNSVNTSMYISDNGIGIFRKIKNKFNLLNEREAILELSKGKLTTNTERHSGEGIFFTSRAFDKFAIASHDIVFTHNDEVEHDVLFDNAPGNFDGTVIFMSLRNESERILKDVFDRFSGDDYGFDKTIIPIELARYGDDNLISRSQAKRVLTRIKLFKSVIFDFKNVPQIGQAFADEIFRVFVNANPNIELDYVNANQDVENMIKRARHSNIDTDWQAHEQIS